LGVGGSFVRRPPLAWPAERVVYSVRQVSVDHADEKQVDVQDPDMRYTCTLEQVVPQESRTISVLRFVHDFTVTLKPKPQLFRQDVTMEVALKSLYSKQHVLEGWLGQSESQPWGF
jgi:hypothetical protein